MRNMRCQKVTVGAFFKLAIVLMGALVEVLTAQISLAETVAERFEKAMKKKAEYCATHKIHPANRRCDILKLKPADPLTTEEGRFAHSIKIPNPVPADSGYKPGMTPEQYFDHLCKTEAGEFIYKTVEDVEGIYQVRPRQEATDDMLKHLYALEDLYGYNRTESSEPENLYVGRGRFTYFETPQIDRHEPDWKKKYKHPSYFLSPDANAKYARYYGYDGREANTMKKEYAEARKSRYGFTWRGIERPEARELGIVGGELIVIDLLTNDVLAVRRGYVRGDVEPPRPGVVWQRPCPLKDDGQFILKVLRPAKQNSSVEGGPDATK